MSQPSFIAKLTKNSREDVRVALDDYQGLPVIDVRIWADTQAGPTSCRTPTKKGVTMDARRLPALIEALEKARAEAERRGVIA